MHQSNLVKSSEKFFGHINSPHYRCIEGTVILQLQNITMPIVFNDNGGGNFAESLHQLFAQPVDSVQVGGGLI